MTVAAFQTVLARLVLDRAFRESFVNQRAAWPRALLQHDLSRRELERLSAVASLPGLDVCRKMHVSFRLARLHTGAPRVFELLMRTGHAVELERFLEQRKPTSFYFAAEAAALLRYLTRRLRSGAIRIPYLPDVMAFERALLRLDAARVRGVDLRLRLRLAHDPLPIFAALEAGKAPPRVRRRPRTLIAKLRGGVLSMAWQTTRSFAAAD